MTSEDHALPLIFAEAKARAAQIISDLGSVMTLPSPQRETELATRGLYPVAVVHGGPEDNEQDKKINSLPKIAASLGNVPLSSGGGDYHVFLFDDHDDADRFAEFVTAEIALPWWRVTRTAAPQYGRPQ